MPPTVGNPRSHSTAGCRVVNPPQYLTVSGVPTTQVLPPGTAVRYLERPALQHLLAAPGGLPREGVGVLQAFVPPRGGRSFTIRADWSPDVSGGVHSRPVRLGFVSSSH